MTTRFSALWGEAYPKLHGAYGESFRHLPQVQQADTRAAPAPDPARPVQTITGIYSDSPAMLSMPNAYDRLTDQRPGAMGGSPTIEIMPVLSNDIDLRRGDFLERVADATRWRIIKCARDEVGVTTCDVALIG